MIGSDDAEDPTVQVETTLNSTQLATGIHSDKERTMRPPLLTAHGQQMMMHRAMHNNMTDLMPRLNSTSRTCRGQPANSGGGSQRPA